MCLVAVVSFARYTRTGFGDLHTRIFIRFVVGFAVELVEIARIFAIRSSYLFDLLLMENDLR